MARTFEYDIMPEIMERWSPRAFDDTSVKREDLMALLEAARYAPSCFNEQPWRFILCDDAPALEKMRGLLTASNQVWANKAPVLLIILSKKTFALNESANYWHMFDAGTAWGYLSLEAQRRGLITHAMGGFDRKLTQSAFDIPGEYDILAVVAIGRYGDKNSLPADVLKNEQPQERVPADTLLL